MAKEKKCTKCGEVKGLECFSKSKSAPDGLQYKCKGCVRKHYQENKEREKERHRKYYQENKEYYKDRKRKYNQENKEYIKEYNRKHRQENKEHYKEYYQKNKGHRKEYNREYYQENQEYYEEYYQENKDSYRANNAKRRARKRSATPEWLTEEQDLKISLYYKIAKALEMMDGVKRHVDHIVPLKGKGVRGLHVPWNLQILTAEQNLNKSNSYSDW